ncbi:MAG: hypothetical protein KatS3mg105_0108 [Gemmatales bacterium]|nr:MAG: hypothetical protein KatS3mg105_0108 [Gemmatales bacterium]
MDATFDAVVRSWPWQPCLVLSLALTASVYARGWLRLRIRGSSRFQKAEVVFFLSGLIAIYLALGSPIEAFSFFLLQAHMVQHLLLMIVAPPLLWLGSPFFADPARFCPWHYGVVGSHRCCAAAGYGAFFKR